LAFSKYVAHEYVITDGNVATIGITDFAAQALGDIVYVDLPEVDEEFEKGESFGSVESVKAASDVYAPIGGTVVETNEALADAPEIINESPEDKGWFMKIKIDDADELDELMDADAYKSFIVD
jgi:glycine cleavage system H protein